MQPGSVAETLKHHMRLTFEILSNKAAFLLDDMLNVEPSSRGVSQSSPFMNELLLDSAR